MLLAFNEHQIVAAKIDTLPLLFAAASLFARSFPMLPVKLLAVFCFSAAFHTDGIAKSLRTTVLSREQAQRTIDVDNTKNILLGN